MTAKTRALQGCYRELERSGITEDGSGAEAYEIVMGLKARLSVEDMDQVAKLLFVLRTASRVDI